MESDLTSLEQRVGACVRGAFFEIGYAVSVIARNRLYKDRGFESLRQYLSSKPELYGAGGKTGLRCLAAYEFTHRLPQDVVLPSNERQVRALEAHAYEDKLCIWMSVITCVASGSELTSKLVHNVARQYKKPSCVILEELTAEEEQPHQRSPKQTEPHQQAEPEQALSPPITSRPIKRKRTQTFSSQKRCLGWSNDRVRWLLEEENEVDETDYSFFLTSTHQEWYTPSFFVERVREVLGGIELDPASCHKANETVKADNIFTKEDDGLQKHWETNSLFVNPPYGKNAWGSTAGMFLDKFLASYETGIMKNGVILLKASIGYQWFAKCLHCNICFLYDRISFCNGLEGGESENKNPHGSVVLYVGEDVQLFKRVFSNLGKVFLAGE